MIFKQLFMFLIITTLLKIVIAGDWKRAYCCGDDFPYSKDDSATKVCQRKLDLYCYTDWGRWTCDVVESKESAFIDCCRSQGRASCD